MASGAPVATRVLVRCTADDSIVFTGHRMSPPALRALSEPRSFRCARCEKVHSWTADVAWCEQSTRLT